MSMDCLEGGGRERRHGRWLKRKNIYATTNHHGLGVEGRGGDAISVRLDAKADGLNDEEGTRGNGRAGEEDEERVDSFICDNQPPRPWS